MFAQSESRLFDEKSIDRGVAGGIAISFALLGLAMLAGGHLLSFIDVPGALIVFGGTFGATLVNYSFEEISEAYRVFRTVVTSRSASPLERIEFLVLLAQKVRQDGLLVLEQQAARCADPFLRMGLDLSADGQPADDIKRILETELITSNERAGRVVHVFQTLGQFAPAMGLIGTLVGLIQMLAVLDKPGSIGPAMSIALLTTLYGAVLANLVFIPIAGKLRNRIAEEALVKALTIEGILSLGRQESAIVVEQRLRSFLPLTPQG